MLAPIIVFLVGSLVAALLALNRFLSFSKQPSALFALVVVLAIYIPISITFLLPIDILSSNDDSKTQHNVFYLNPKYIMFLWKFDYWSSFVLMWTILPFIQEYYRSGEFTRINKVKDSIKSNLKFQLIVGAIGIGGLIYFFIKFGFHFQTFKSLLIALSHTYSLILSLWLMSHGLINIPKRRWLRNLNLDHQLEQLYLELPKIYDDLNDTTFNYKDICSTIKALERIPGIFQSNFSREVAILIDSLPTDLEFGNHIRSTEFTSLQQLTHTNLAKLHSTLKTEATHYRSSSYEFNKAVSAILKLQDIISSKSKGVLQFRYHSNFLRNERLNYLTNVYFIPFFNLFLAVFLFLLSLVIIESEMLHSTKFSIVNMFLISEKISPTGKLIVSIIFITYMISCALISLTRIKIFKIYHLFPENSNPVSVIFFTMYSNRLTVPLSYNFLTLLQTGKIHSQFNEFLGKSINLSILGGFFNANLPRLIVIPIILTTFNVFDRIRRRFSFEYFDELASDAEDPLEGNRRDLFIKEGKAIVQRELTASTTTNNRLHFLRPIAVSVEPPALFNEDEVEQLSIGARIYRKFSGLFARGGNSGFINITDTEEDETL